jgi:hypothetical protein
VYIHERLLFYLYFWTSANFFWGFSFVQKSLIHARLQGYVHGIIQIQDSLLVALIFTVSVLHIISYKHFWTFHIWLNFIFSELYFHSATLAIICANMFRCLPGSKENLVSLTSRKRKLGFLMGCRCRRLLVALALARARFGCLGDGDEVIALLAVWSEVSPSCPRSVCDSLRRSRDWGALFMA